MFDIQESFHAPGHPDRPYVQATELKLGVSYQDGLKRSEKSL